MDSEKATSPVSVVIIGAGNRAWKYLRYILDNTDRIKVSAVVEIVELRRKKMAEAAHLSDECCFSDWNDFFASDIKTDAAIICTPDDMHYEPCLKALRHGCHVLLEKPIACTSDQCDGIAAEASLRGLSVATCHVLRYHPYFMMIKELVSSGELGSLVSISHRASVGTDRSTHSYVRGKWSRTANSNPMFLSKCCHDVDLMVWLTESRYAKLSSFGSLRWFRASEAPELSSSRCVDCAIEQKCQFSAVDLYKRRREWTSNFDIPEDMTLEQVIDRELSDGPFGRCVYRCDNDVVDHQILAMEMENGVTVELSMDCFTLDDNRVTHICLTGGEINGDEHTIEVKRFKDRSRRVMDFSHLSEQKFHAGADLRLIEDFTNFISGLKNSLTTSIENSLESHHICFDAEVSRLQNRMITRDN